MKMTKHYSGTNQFCKQALILRGLDVNRFSYMCFRYTHADGEVVKAYCFGLKGGGITGHGDTLDKAISQYYNRMGAKD